MNGFTWWQAWGGNIIAVLITIAASFVGWIFKRRSESRFSDAEKRILELEKQITNISTGRDAIVAAEKGQIVTGNGSFAVGGDVHGDIKNSPK